MPAINRSQLAKILGMLDSAHDGEALNAARQAVKMVKEAGTTWAEVLRAQHPADQMAMAPVHRPDRPTSYSGPLRADQRIAVPRGRGSLSKAWQPFIYPPEGTWYATVAFLLNCDGDHILPETRDLLSNMIGNISTDSWKPAYALAEWISTTYKSIKLDASASPAA